MGAYDDLFTGAQGDQNPPKTGAYADLFQTPKPVSNANPIFPAASQVPVTGAGSLLKKVLMGALDLTSLPRRAVAAAFTDQNLNDPGAYALKKATESVQGKTPQGPTLDPYVDALDFGVQPNSARDFEGMVGESLSDPLSFIPAGGKTVSSLADVGEKVIPSIASREMQIPVESLNFGSSDAGRKALDAAGARRAENVTGQSLADELESWGDPRRSDNYAKVETAAAQAPDIDIRPTLEAFDAAKKGPYGTMGSSTVPIQRLNSSLEAYKNAFAGNLPTAQQIAEMDFAGNLDPSKAALADPQSKWGVLQKISDQAKAKANAATDASSVATSRAQGSAARVPALKALVGTSEAPDAAAMIDAVSKAKSDAIAAQSAYVDAQAKLAAGKITAQDALRAQSDFDDAVTRLHVADAANEFSQGQTLDQVSKTLASKYPELQGDDLSSVLSQGREKVGNNSFTPNYKISAPDFLALRRALDEGIDHSTSEGTLLNEALKVPRKQMSDALSVAFGGEGSAGSKAMKDWHDELSLVNEIKGLINSNSETGAASRAGSVLDNLFTGSPSQAPKKNLVSEFGDMVGKDYITPAQEENYAKDFATINQPSGGRPTFWDNPKGGGHGLSPVLRYGFGLLGLNSPATAVRIIGAAKAANRATSRPSGMLSKFVLAPDLIRNSLPDTAQ